MKKISMLEFRRNAKRAIDAVQRGERFLLTYRGKAIARLEPVGSEEVHVPPDDPLLRIDDFSVEGPGGRLGNEEIDDLIYEP
jgi:antitoxin (DNA-binding transcriptional repressor) of toxin-antitoxin stability system